MANNYSDKKRDEEEDYSNWSNVPDDIRVEILCRLPIKHMIRFKCVSKSCYSLISNTCVPRITPPSMSASLSGFLFRCAEFSGGSDDAVIDYAPYGPSSSRDDDDDDDDDDRFVKSYSTLLPLGGQTDEIDVQDCCNGLLLVSLRSAVPVEYYVCNPVTEQCIPIPINPTHRKPMFAALTFDPSSESPNYYNYKVVRFNRSGASASINHPPILDVISSETGLWVTHTVQLHEPELYGFHWMKRSVYLNGVLYMLSLAKYLLCFDLKSTTVTARCIELPEKDTTDNLGFIGISRGRLYYSNRDHRSTIFIWSLRCCGDWILNHTISIIDDLVLHNPLGKILDRYRHSSFFKPYAIHPTSPQVIFLGIPDMILSYDLKTRRLEKVFQAKSRTMIVVGQYGVFPYSRCPVALKDCVPHNTEQPLTSHQFLEFKAANSSPRHHIPSHPVLPPCHSLTAWNFPSENWITMNCAVAVREDKSYMAWLARNHDGKALGFWVEITSYIDPDIAECIAIKNAAITSGIHKRWTKVIFESESHNSVDATNSKDANQSWVLRRIAYSYREFRECYPEWKFCEIPRAFNSAAHNLAQWAARLDFSGSLDANSPPLPVAQALLSDLYSASPCLLVFKYLTGTKNNQYVLEE